MIFDELVGFHFLVYFLHPSIFLKTHNSWNCKLTHCLTLEKDGV